MLDAVGSILQGIAKGMQKYQLLNRQLRQDERDEDDRQLRRRQTEETLEASREERERARLEREADADRRRELEELVGGVPAADARHGILLNYARLQPDYIDEALEYETPESLLARDVEKTRATTTAREEASEPFRIRSDARAAARARISAGGGGGAPAAGDGGYPKMSPTQANDFMGRLEIMAHSQGMTISPRDYARLHRQATTGGLTAADVDEVFGGEPADDDPAPPTAYRPRPTAPPVPGVTPPPTRAPLPAPRSGGRGATGAGLSDDDLSEARQLVQQIPAGEREARLRQFGFSSQEIRSILGR